MRLFNIGILLFALSAFLIGVNLAEQDKSLIDGIINNVSVSIENITLEYLGNESSIPKINGFFLVLEKYIKFVGALALEVLRAGIYFGHDNPDYFEPDYLFSIMRLIIWALIISLLIKPVGYLIIFIIIGCIYLRDKLRKTQH